MVRHGIVKQESIYQTYLLLAKKFVETTTHANDNANWQLISNEGLWKLPVSKQYGGAGLSWDECVVAIRALMKNFRHAEFISSIISHLAVIYLLLQYGTEAQKNQYLSQIMQGCATNVCEKHDYVNERDILHITILNEINISFSIENNQFIHDDFINFKKLLSAVLIDGAAINLAESGKELFGRGQSSDVA